MLLAFLGLVGFLAFAPRAALSVFELIAYSPIRQCGPFNVSFSGGQTPPALPLILTVIPFNSTRLAFAIPESAWDNSTNSGSYVTFLPLPAGVALMASLDDADGNSAAVASEVIQIRPSNDYSCISTKTAAPTTFQLVDSTVSQCLPFRVSQNSPSLTQRSSLRVFVPTTLSFRLQSVAFHTNDGIDVFTYIMSVARGFQVALLFDDGEGNRQVSDLLSVGGGEFSPSECLLASPTPSPTAVVRANNARGLSRPAMIAIAVTSPVIALIFLILGLITIRRERRKRAALRRGLITAVRNQSQTYQTPNPQLGPPVPPRPCQTPAGMSTPPVPVDPVYPADLFMNPSTGSRPLRSTRSTVLSPSIPSDLGSGKYRSNASQNGGTGTRYSVNGTSIHSLVDLDIVGLLEAASQRQAEVETPRGSPRTPPLSVPPISTSMALPSRPTQAFCPWRRLLGQKRSDQELDVPLSPLKRLSQVSLTPQGPSPQVAENDTTVTMTSYEASSRKRAPSTPFRDEGGRGQSKNSVLF
ncbi:hypothetical protein BJV78DRAFT_1216823 [Lactifluus subvellereus]|nr:hypothetical protein BJV78DRAFT_1216823 [Lactifluus subvellereus]